MDIISLLFILSPISSHTSEHAFAMVFIRLKQKVAAIAIYY